MSHIFISYSVKNAEYAYQVADKLREEGFNVWIDNDELRSSDNWWESIVRALRAASAFVVIMSPESRESRWVQREVMLADTWGKPAFPLLFDGDNFEIYVLTQFHDVRGAKLPDKKFYDALAIHAQRKRQEGLFVTTDSRVQAPMDAAIQAALNEPPPSHETMPPALQIIRDLLPPPFDFCEIPEGEVLLEGGQGSYIPEESQRRFTVSNFYMAKYPVTNAQYAKFIEAGGYQTAKYWTKAGWQIRKEKNWQASRYWGDERFSGEHKPVVGVSWYEAIAFCLWLNAMLGNSQPRIMLPTEQQWQRAAQGDDGREYPWGNAFDREKTNTNEANIIQSTVVTAYPQSASPYGVLDMAGNVWEWCLTDWETGENDWQAENGKRLQRGGSYANYGFNARTNFRMADGAAYRDHVFGFRICLNFIDTD